jgi:transcriptional regulator with XRE-family HTH domain
MKRRTEKTDPRDAANIRMERERLGFSQEELSLRANITCETLRNTESGKQQPQSKTIFKIMNAIQEAWEERSD